MGVSKVDGILKAIPDDEWVKAVDLEKKTGIRAQEIGALISHHLLNEFIERGLSRARDPGRRYRP